MSKNILGESGAQAPSTAPRLGVLLSGTGRTLANFIKKADRGEFDGQIVVVVSSVAGAKGLRIAESVDIPTYTIQRKAFDSDSAFSQSIYRAVEPYAPDLLLLAGFLRRIEITPEWNRRVLNIHPALLPEMAYAAGKGMYGDRVHAAALEHGAARTGATVHVVDNDYDEGEILATLPVPILLGDGVQEVADRVFSAECELYPTAVTDYVSAHPELVRGR